MTSMEPFQVSLKLAFEMFNSGRSVEAEALCRVLLPMNPRDAQLQFLLGMILHKAGRDGEAIEHFTAGLTVQPDAARLHSGLGCAHLALKEYARAAEAFGRAMNLQPNSSSTCFNYGNCCYQLDRLEQAAELFRKAVELDPKDALAWNNLGKCLKEINRLDESIEAFDQALKIDPNYANGHYGRSSPLLAAGRLPEGFAEYEWRLPLRMPRAFAQPKWKGDSINDKILFLHAEQGYGDSIQMLRFLPEVRRRVGKVILECRPEIRSYFEFCCIADVVVPFGGEIPPFDVYLPEASLPRVLGVTMESIPNQVPYLLSPPPAPMPGARPDMLKVGLVWAGSPDHVQDHLRSVTLETLAPIFKISGIQFYRLQKVLPQRDLNYLKSLGDLIQMNTKLDDFVDTAAAIAALDLVVTVDTGVAHLAGALGKPVWILLQFSADWRWLMERTDSPWYPTARLFRQSKRSCWTQPVEALAEALAQRVVKRKNELSGIPVEL